MRSIYNIIGMVAFVVTVCSDAVAADAKTTAEALWTEAIAAYEAKEYSSAVDKFEHISELPGAKSVPDRFCLTAVE